MGVHGIGRGLLQVQLTHLLPHISRDELDGRLHFGHHALSFRNPLQTRRAKLFLLGNSADRSDVFFDITGDELPVATHAALQIHKVIRMADGPYALGHLLALPGEALMLVASDCDLLLGLLQTG